MTSVVPQRVNNKSRASALVISFNRNKEFFRNLFSPAVACRE
jgi:hypothetical protein